jgi:hypothetical protein
MEATPFSHGGEGPGMKGKYLDGLHLSLTGVTERAPLRADNTHL